MKPLAGVRVLELTDETAAFTGRILADLGADVVMLEPPGGSRSRYRKPVMENDSVPRSERSFTHQYFNANKRSAIVAGTHERVEGEGLTRWAETADVVIATPPFRLPYDLAAAANPNVVYVSVTPFGLEGPWRDRKANDLVSLAAGGLLYLSGEPKGVPVQGGAHSSYTITGLVAATGVMLALFNGGGAHLDIARQEATAMLTFQTGAPWQWRWLGVTPRRPGISNAARCADGRYVGLMVRPDRFDLFLRWLDELGIEHALTPADWHYARVTSPQINNPVNAATAAIARMLARDEFVEGAIRAEMVCLPTMEFADMEHHEQFVVNRQFATLRHDGINVDLSFVRSPVDAFEEPTTIAPAPLLPDQAEPPAPPAPAGFSAPSSADTTERRRRPRRSDDPHRALEGIRVVDFGWVLAAPIGTRILASFGAEVIRVESSAKPDSIRSMPGPDGKPHETLSGLFNDVNAGKKSLSVDLSDPRGCDLVHRLVAKSDVVVNNFRPGALERMGFGFDALKEDRHDIVLLNTPGPHRFGPWAHQPSMGNIMMGASGFNYLTGFDSERPRGIGIAYPDFTNPYLLVTTILGALLERDRTGHGHEIHLAQLSGMVSLLGAEWMQFKATGRQPPRRANRDENYCPHGVYRTEGDDEWVAIAVEGDDEWGGFAAMIGVDPVDDRFATHDARKANEDELDALVTRWTATRDRWEIADLCQDIGIAAAAVETLPDMMDRDPQLRGHFQTVQQPDFPDVEIPVRREAIRFLGATQNVRRAPALGEHNDHVARELVGIGEEEYLTLVIDGVLS